MPAVEHVEHSDGSHSVGVKIEGVHVPFASLDAPRVAQLVEYGKAVAESGAGSESGKDA